jgi:hypothetical protein
MSETSLVTGHNLPTVSEALANDKKDFPGL